MNIEAVCNITPVPESSLNNRHSMIDYHKCKEVVETATVQYAIR